jgi:hypothetical protein
MANIMRWRYGDTNPVVLPVLTGTEVEIGDLVYLDTDNVKPASDQPDQSSEVANQELLHDNFAGVAMQRSPVGSTTPIRVATTGVFEFDCNDATFEVGDLIGIDESGSGTRLEDQRVTSVASENLATGRCAKRVNPSSTAVLVDIVSTVARGGPQAPA